MGTVSALTPDTAATGLSSVAVAKEVTGEKSFTALESRRAEPRQTAGRHQGNGIAACDFAPDSLLATQEGLRPIEQIRLGDWVWAYDETTGVNSLKEVVRTFARDTDWVVILEIGNEVVQATLEHPFWQDGIGWRRAGELTAGDRIQSISGVPATVTHAEHRLAPQPVFNIEVTDAHTYFVSPTKLLVHNACTVYAAKGAAGAADDIYVIGRQVDTAVAKDWAGHKILDIPNWTLKKNDAWVQGIIDSRAKVYIGTPQTLWDAANSRPTVFARELEQLRAAGYKQVGDYMHPPGP